MRLRSSPPAALLLAALAFDLLRALTVPASSLTVQYNLDEAFHFVDALNASRRLSYAVRHTFGSPEPPPIPLVGGTVPIGSFPRGATYYYLQAIPQALLDGADDATRLFVARLVSIGLHLLVIALTYHIGQRLFSDRKYAPLPLTGAVFAAFVPSYSDMMSAVNLEVGVAAGGAVFLAALVAVMKTPRRPTAWAALAVTGLIGWSIKETFWPLIGAAGLSLWLMTDRRIKIISLTSGVVALGVAVLWLRPFTPGGAAHWLDAYWVYGREIAPAPRAVTEAPIGKYTIRLSSDFSPLGVTQYVPENRVADLRGRRVTWGAWLRASAPTTISAPTFSPEADPIAPKIEAGRAWRFVAFKSQVPQNAQHLAFRLSAPTDGASVEYDGLVAAVGDFPLDEPPVFDEAEGRAGMWGGKSFSNLLLNPSAEAGWPQVKSEYSLQPWSLNTRLVTILAWQRTALAAPGFARWLLANYWSAFGGLLPGLSPRQLIPFVALTSWVAFGLAWTLVFDRPRQSVEANLRLARYGLYALLAASAASWLVVLYRADFAPNAADVIVWASSRHASGGASATSILMGLGWQRAAQAARLPARARRWLTAALIFGLFAVNAWILLGVQIPVYRCALPLMTDCLPTVHGP